MHTAPEKRTARFWTYHNGDWVKLSLRPGDSLSHEVYMRTEEGYHAEGTTWEHCGDYISRETNTDGRDCDGRASSRSLDMCPLDKLAAVACFSYHGYYGMPSIPALDEKGQHLRRAMWDELRPTRCRDYTAEAAGY